MPRRFFLLLLLHAALLVLAATNFTPLKWLWGDRSWQISAFSIRYSFSWGHPSYEMIYPLSRVLAYIAAYGAGFPLFAAALRRHWPVTGWCGLILCAAGALSFTLELSHWVFSHHFSLIVSIPALFPALWLALACLAWLERPSISPPFTSAQPCAFEKTAPRP